MFGGIMNWWEGGGNTMFRIQSTPSSKAVHPSRGELAQAAKYSPPSPVANEICSCPPPSPTVPPPPREDKSASCKVHPPPSFRLPPPKGDRGQSTPALRAPSPARDTGGRVKVHSTPKRYKKFTNNLISYHNLRI